MGSRDYSEEALTSNLAYRILCHLFRNGEDYPTGIANNLDSSYQSVNNYMKGLRELKLVEKTREEGKKRFYEINKEQIVGLWGDTWHQKFDELSDEQWDSLTNRINKEFEVEYESEVSFQEEWDQMKDLFARYYENYLESIDSSNLEKMMVKDFITPLALYVEGAIGGEETDIEAWMVLWERIMVSTYLEKDTEGVNSFLSALKEKRDN